MTIKELSQLYWLNREVELQKKQLAALEAEIERDKEELHRLRLSLDGLRPANTDGMPHGTGVHSPVEDTVDHIITLEAALSKKHEALVNLTARISARTTLIILERDRLEQYIRTIPDPYTRQVFTLRFVNGLPWQQVAASLGREETWDSVKRMCYRYIRRH